MLDHPGDATRGQLAGRHATVRIGGARQGAHHRGQVEGQLALIFHRAFDMAALVGPQPGLTRVALDQRDALRLAAGQGQVVQRLLVDVEHRRRGAVLRRHVGDGGAIAQGQAGRAFAEEFQIGGDDLLGAQEFGQRQHDVGGGDARLRTPGEAHADDVRQAHVGGTPQHHALGLQPADADGDHAQRIDMRRVAVGAHQGIREGDLMTLLIGARLDHRRHPLQIDLVHDAVARWDHVDVLEGLTRPVDEVEAVLVATLLDGAILGEGVLVEAGVLHRQRVVDDQLGRHHRIDLGRVTAALGDGIAQAGQVDQRGLTEDVMAHDARGIPGEIEITPPFDQLHEAVTQLIRRAATHQVLGQYA